MSAGSGTSESLRIVNREGVGLAGMCCMAGEGREGAEKANENVGMGWLSFYPKISIWIRCFVRSCSVREKDHQRHIRATNAFHRSYLKLRDREPKVFFWQVKETKYNSLEWLLFFSPPFLDPKKHTSSMSPTR
jgi:hypothetical protein